jgi:hypothetical protein
MLASVNSGTLHLTVRPTFNAIPGRHSDSTVSSCPNHFPSVWLSDNVLKSNVSDLVKR